MTDVPKADLSKSGKLGWSRDGACVLMRCPNGHISSLVAGSEHAHIILPDGVVSPSVVCPREGCGFHESVRLLNWSV